MVMETQLPGVAAPLLLECWWVSTGCDSVTYPLRSYVDHLACGCETVIFVALLLASGCR
jgi:hypothetical protein